MISVPTRTLQSDPLRNFKFVVSIPLQQNGVNPPMATLGFMQVQGLGMTIEPLTYREGGDNVTALPLDAPVLTTSGWKPMGEIEVGDRVIDPMGQESKVVDLLPVVEKDVYEITLGDGSKARACWGHLWTVEVTDSNNKTTVQTMSTLEMKSLVDKTFVNGASHFKVKVPKVEPAVFDVAADLPVDPYVLGILLAEGSLENEGVSFVHGEGALEILHRVEAGLPAGHFLSPKRDGDGEISAWRISVGNRGAGPRNVYGRNQVLQGVRDLGLLGHRAWEKFIPEAYKFANISDRWRLLQGIMDGDGWVDENGCTQFSSTSEQLARDVQFLIRSLGGRCGALRVSSGRSYVYGGELRPARDTYSFSGVCDLSFTPFSLTRKVERYRLSEKTSSQFRRVRSVELVGHEAVRCLEVSADSHLFLSYDFVPSHNTRKMPGQADFNPITLTRGLFPNDWQTWYWVSELFSVLYGTGFNGNNQPIASPPYVAGSQAPNFRTHMYINILEHPNNTAQASLSNPSAITVMSLKLYQAWPTTFAISDLDAGANAVGIQQMQIAYEGFDMHFGPGLGGYVPSPTQW